MQNNLPSRLTIFLQKFKIVWNKYFSKSPLALILILLLVITIPLAVQLALQQQHLQNEAAMEPSPVLIKRPAGIFAVFAVDGKPNNYSYQEVETVLKNQADSGIVLRERWENLEPHEGNYNFSRIDKTIELAA